MIDTGNIKVMFVAGFGPIVQDNAESQRHYLSTLGLPLKNEGNGYCHSDEIEGVRHFALWPLSQAAESCFGTREWPSNIQVPQAWIEFDVEDIERATAELKTQGQRLLVEAKKEPWGQIVTRFLSPEGLLVGITHTPWMRKREK